MSHFRHRGTRNASVAGVTETLLVCTALVETVLVAGFVLRAGRVGEGGTLAEAFLRSTALILLPLRIVPVVSAAARQGLAIVVYGGCLLVLIGLSSWLERRRALD